MRRLPRGVTEKNYVEVRDALLMQLMLLGHDVPGDWEDWHLTATGATHAQLWGSARTDPSARLPEWWLTYEGPHEWIQAISKSWRYCGRHLVKDCLLEGTSLKEYKESEQMGSMYFTHHVGMEFDPPEQEDREGQFINPEKRRKVAQLTYKCEVCGHEWVLGRTPKHDQMHTKDGGRLVFVKKEIV